MKHIVTEKTVGFLIDYMTKTPFAINAIPLVFFPKTMGTLDILNLQFKNPKIIPC
jgi:hypothetical protein